MLAPHPKWRTAVISDDAAVWSVRVEHEGDGTVLRVKGDLDLETAPLLIADAEPYLTGTADLIIALSRLYFIDSSGLSALIRLHKQRSGGGRRFEIISPAPTVAKAFQITGLDQVLPLRA